MIPDIGKEKGHSRERENERDIKNKSCVEKIEEGGRRCNRLSLSYSVCN
jgi:hypothetical protein